MPPFAWPSPLACFWRCGALPVLVLAAVATAGAAEEPSAGDDHRASAILAALDAANRARASLGEEEQAWASERLRLATEHEALAQERERLEQQLTAATAARDAAQAQARALVGDGELATLRRTAQQAVLAFAQALVREAGEALPGAVVAPAHPEQATRAEVIQDLDRSEHAASVVAVDLVSGSLAGQTTAVTLLRVGDQRGWWLSLDQTRAGTACMQDGTLLLTPATDPATRTAIQAAIAIVQGRRPAQFVSLPADPPIDREDNAGGAAGGGR